MRRASSAYKEIMDRRIRNRAYVSVGLGVVNQDAQKDATVSTECVNWCNPNAIFDNNTGSKIYATMEQNFMKSDGSMYFLPEEYLQERTNCAISTQILGSLRIDFDNNYSIKGLTIDFGESYPTEFTVQTADRTLTYKNNLQKFDTTDVMGDTHYIIITPISMVGGQQRLRIYSIVMGVGLTFYNADVKDVSINDSISLISEELPSINTTLNLFDKGNMFNVDDNNSFILFLETMQKISLSFGLELDNGDIEWIKYATLFLSDWDSKEGMLRINAVDRISQMEDEYTDGNKIYERTAYSEAVSILKSAGLEIDEYMVDEYLQDIILKNPMPAGSHSECLQLLANACRCILYQDTEGRVVIKANFANVIEPEDLRVETNGVTAWSNPENILYGTYYVYAELKTNFIKADGTMYFLPEDSSYLETSYVSEQVSDENGLFEENPLITIMLPAAYTYYGITIKFDGNPPKELIIHTYSGDTLVQNVVFGNLSQETTLYYEFTDFDKIVLEFSRTEPCNRVLVNQIAFGELTDYLLTKENMFEKPHGYVEKKTKSVNVKVFTYENNEKGELQEVEDNVYVRRELSNTGKNIYCENPLVSTQEHAALLAEWLGNYYANNVSYDVNYRGEPRLSSSDIIKMESDVLSNLQVEIINQTLKFNGVFSGTLQLRKSLRMV